MKTFPTLRMKFLATLALIAATTQAIQLKEEPALANLLVQTAADIDADVDVEVDAEEGYGDPYDHHDPHYDCDYNCPPALERCPGVLQPPGPCKSAIKERPLCYCNSGFMHTDWDHHLSVEDKACTDLVCGKKKDKPTSGYPPHNPHQGYKPAPTPYNPYPSYSAHAENDEEDTGDE